MLLAFWNSYGQERISITEATLRLTFEETKEMFYSFAEGDEIILNLSMVRGKHIKEVEIIELPNNSIFLEFKAKKIENKRIKIRNKGMYKFRFYSSSITNRICKFSIDRIPESIETTSFNTNWKWLTVKDTIYTPYQIDSLIGYKTTVYQETIRELKSEKLEEIMLFEKSQTVHSYYNENISKSYLKVELPIINSTFLREENILAWSYWIGVGQESQEAYSKNVHSATKSLGNLANLYYQTPLAGIALGAISNLVTPQIGEDIEYYFIPDFQNVQNFYNNQSFLQFDMGKGRAAYGRNDSLKEGTFYIGLSNDNLLKSIEVNVKVLVVKKVKVYENVVYNRQKKEPEYVTLNKIRRNIIETKIRVPIE